MAEPYFSVLITAYNRAGQLSRCLRSCQDQTFPEFEIVVVDDASTDGTAALLAGLDEPRLRVVTHPENRGISPARATSVQHARGRWLVMLDSDWELVPHTLDRLRSVIDELPPGVRMIRSRLRWDDGSVSPLVIPEGVSDYHGRLAWLDAVMVNGGSSDAGHCIHRAVFDVSSYPHDRRGVIETLWETDTARREPSLWIPDVLGLQHVDAANSASRDASARRLIPRLVGEAPDLQWMAETMLSRHGPDLARHAPHYHRWLLESAAREAFLAGHRRAGIRHTRAAVRAGAGGAQLWATLVLGVVGPRPLAYAKVAGRQTRSRGTRTARGGA
jgi:glycosyltransferase involved in cell wall biosynthesis